MNETKFCFNHELQILYKYRLLTFKIINKFFKTLEFFSILIV